MLPSPPFSWWSEAQRLRLAGACIYASVSLAVAAAAALVASTAMASVLSAAAMTAKSTPTTSIVCALSTSLWSPLHPRFAFYVLMMSAAQSLATVAAGKAARACPPSKSLFTMMEPRASASSARRSLTSTKSSTAARLASTALAAASSAASRLALDGAASARATVTFVVACSLAGWAIVPLFCSLVSSSSWSSSSSPLPPSPPPPFLVSVPPWAQTLGLLVGASHALSALALGDDVVVVASSLRRARAFAVKRAAADSVGRAAATATAVAAALFAAASLGVASQGGGGIGGAGIGGAGIGGAGIGGTDSTAANETRDSALDEISHLRPPSPFSSSFASAASALVGAALASHALLVGGAAVRAAFAERTQFDAEVVCSSGTLGPRTSAAEGAVTAANDGLVSSIVAATRTKRARGKAAAAEASGLSPLEASLFDLAVRVDAAALAEATPGSSWAWRRSALFADGIVGGRRGGVDVVVVGGGGAAGVSSSSASRGDCGEGFKIPAAFPGRAWSAVVGGLCLSELAPALSAVGAALAPQTAAATASAASTSGRGEAPPPSSMAPPRWNQRPAASGPSGGGGFTAAVALAKKIAAKAASSLSSSSSSKALAPSKKPSLPPAVLRAQASALLRRRWQHLALALRTLGALAAAAAEEDAAGVAQLAGGGGGGVGDGTGTVDDDPFSSSSSASFSCRGTDLGSVLSALLAAAIAFGAAAEPGALPGGASSPSSSLPCVAPPGLRKLAAALDDDGRGGGSAFSPCLSSLEGARRRDPAAAALADVALGAAHRAVSAYGEDAARAVAKAAVPASAWASAAGAASGSSEGGGKSVGGVVSESAVSALIEAVLSGRD